MGDIRVWRWKGTMLVQRIDDLAQLEALAEEWARLAMSVPDPVPFWAPQWVLPWWKHFARHGAVLSDELRAYAFRNRDGALVGFAPFAITQWPGIGPISLRRLQVLGADPAITEVNPVLAAPEHAAEVWNALLAALQEDGGFDRARWWVVDGAAAASALQREACITWQGERPMFVLDLPSTWEELKSSRPRNIKESLRKCYNSLARDGHRFELVVRSKPAELYPALDRFFALHHERATQTDTVTHGDWFEPAVARTFLHEAAQSLARTGQALVFELVVRGKVVATRVGFLLGSSLYLYYSGYSSEWAKYSVMTTCTAEAIQWAIRQGLKTVNLSFGRDVSKTRWAPREVMYRGSTMLAWSARARFAGRLQDELEPRVKAALASPRLASLRGLLQRA